jgi:hypothetical protein
MNNRLFFRTGGYFFFDRTSLLPEGAVPDLTTNKDIMDKFRY